MNIVQMLILITSIMFAFSVAFKFDSILGLFLFICIMCNCFSLMLLTKTVDIYSPSYLLISGKVDDIYTLVNNSSGKLNFTEDKQSLLLMINRDSLDLNAISNIAEATDSKCTFTINARTITTSDATSCGIMKLMKAQNTSSASDSFEDVLHPSINVRASFTNAIAYLKYLLGTESSKVSFLF